MSALAFAQLGSQLLGNRHQDMFNRKAANVAFDRQNMLRNTAHQAEVADLRAAGLNPILSGTGGMGASTPSVSAPSGTGSPGVDFAGASAKSAQTTLMEKETEKVSQDIATSKSLASMYDATAGRERETAEDIRQSNVAGGGTYRAGASYSSARLAEQGILSQQQQIKESAQKVLNLIQDVITSRSVADVNRGVVKLNSDQRKVLLEEIRFVQKRSDLTASQREALELTLNGLRNKSEVDASALGKANSIFQQMEPMMDFTRSFGLPSADGGASTTPYKFETKGRKR